MASRYASGLSRPHPASLQHPKQTSPLLLQQQVMCSHLLSSNTPQHQLGGQISSNTQLASQSSGDMSLPSQHVMNDYHQRNPDPAVVC